MSIATDQRYVRGRTCPICGGRDGDPRGTGERCFGFLSSDGLYAHCTREEHAGGLPLGDESGTYAHRLEGDCRCGVRHGGDRVGESTPRSAPPADGRRLVDTFDYRVNGELRFQVVRYEPKDFRQRRPHPTTPGEWVWKLDGLEPTLYHHDDLVGAPAGSTVYIVEGERKVEALRRLGRIAVCNVGGAGPGKWRDAYVPLFRGQHVVILPDHDAPGQAHGERIARSLLGTAASVKVVHLPGLPAKGDVVDWLAAGGTTAALDLVVANAAPVAPTPTPTADAPRLAWETAAALAATASETVRWRVKPYLADETLTEFDGVMKLGKTTWVLALVGAVLDGAPFLGEPTEPSPVVYLTEQGRPSFVAALRRAGLLDRTDLHILRWTEAAGTPWPEIVADAVVKAKAVGAKVLVVDTLSQWAGLDGEKENAAGEALAAMAPLQKAAAQGLAVLLVRHEGKRDAPVGQAARGSSAFGGVADVILSLRRPEGKQAPNLRVLYALSRFDDTPAQLVVEWTGTGYVARGTETNVATQAARAALLEEAPDDPDHAISLDSVLGRRTGVSKTTAKREAGRLVDAGALKTVGGGRRGDPLRYFRPPVAGA